MRVRQPHDGRAAADRGRELRRLEGVLPMPRRPDPALRWRHARPPEPDRRQGRRHRLRILSRPRQPPRRRRRQQGHVLNPKKSPETCFQCHLDKRAQFSLPHSHQVLNGKMGCGDCHDVHKGNAIAGTGVDLEDMNAACTKCYTQQKGPFVYEHSAMREGCIAGHNAHGSVNPKMLVARDANLCLRCHLESPDPGSSGQINANAIRRTAENHSTRMNPRSAQSVAQDSKTRRGRGRGAALRKRPDEIPSHPPYGAGGPGTSAGGLLGAPDRGSTHAADSRTGAGPA